MSDTNRVLFPCEHVRGEGHIVSEGRAGKVEWCHGGKQVVFRRMSWTEFGDSVESEVWVEEATDEVEVFEKLANGEGWR